MEKSENNSEVLKTYCDFLWKALSETATALTKGMTFYLAIIAAVTGYVLTKELSPELLNLALILGVGVSFLAALSATSIGWGLHKGLQILEQSLKEMNMPLYQDLHIDSFFKRGRRVIWIVLFCSFFVLAAFVFSMIYLFH